MSILFITPSFSWAELSCHDGSETPEAVKPHLRRLCEAALEPIRTRWGGPIVVVSGYRSPVYNTRIGGARLSRHVSGEAADIRPVSLSRVADLRLLIEDMIRDGDLPEVGGVGSYRNWIHVDVRAKQDGHIARWSGVGVGSEETA